MDSEGVRLPAKVLYRESSDLVEQIVSETDPEELENLTRLFTLNQRKKDIARMDRLSKILELVDDEIVHRVSNTPESINNDQLIKYMGTTQQSLTSIEQGLSQVPTIQINNQKNEIHIENSGLSQESRKIVLDKVQEILSRVRSDNIIDITEDSEGA